MLKGIFRKLIVVFAVMFSSLYCFAQQYHFVYIQADNQQPFYIKYDGKNYSSSSIGYLILPKLNDGSFSIQVGFPKNLYPEQAFNLSVAGKDLGFALKNFADKGWGLFNFQTTDIVMNVNASAASEVIAKPAITTTNTANPFGNMLADAINDSTLNQQRVIPKDTASVAVNSPVSMDSSKASQATAPNTQNTAIQTGNLTKNDTPADNDNSAKAKATVDSTLRIIKSSENTTSNGTDLTFLDNVSKDTIHAFIPSSDTVKTATKDNLNTEVKASVNDTIKSKIDNPFFNNTNNTSASQPAMQDTANNTTAETKGNIITNSNCLKMLSSYDADRLKKKIISLHSQDDILAAVKKSLRDKCITTDQVEDLSNLFLSDENRYNFYDAVYPNVSDYFNYPQLQSTLIDTYYKNRFKALLR